MIRIDLMPNSKFPWRLVSKVVISVCFCSVLSLVVYTSWNSVVVSVERFFETMEDPDSILATADDLLDDTIVLDSLIQQDSLLNDKKITEGLGLLRKDSELKISILDTTRDHRKKEVHADPEQIVLDSFFSVTDNGSREKLKYSGNCYIAFDVLEDLSSFVDLELLVCGDRGIYEISGVIDGLENLTKTKLNNVADEYFEGVKIDSWKDFNNGLFFSMLGVVREKKFEKKVTIDKNEEEDFFSKARKLAEISCLEDLSYSDAVVFDSDPDPLRNIWHTKITGIGSIDKCEAFVTSLRSLEPNVSVSEIILTPIVSASGIITEIRFGISLLALDASDR
ncbi:MAG: hypothetical protein VX294_01630 [Candidatus Latescibacterota bacterium]|nr:hypothetical protein [Candidatus Latescibacterota bacterium]